MQSRPSADHECAGNDNHFLNVNSKFNIIDRPYPQARDLVWSYATILTDYLL